MPPCWAARKLSNPARIAEPALPDTPASGSQHSTEPTTATATPEVAAITPLRAALEVNERGDGAAVRAPRSLLRSLPGRAGTNPGSQESTGIPASHAEMTAADCRYRG
jgi:hypothetical protein